MGNRKCGKQNLGEGGGGLPLYTHVGGNGEKDSFTNRLLAGQLDA